MPHSQPTTSPYVDQYGGCAGSKLDKAKCALKMAFNIVRRMKGEREVSHDVQEFMFATAELIPDIRESMYWTFKMHPIEIEREKMMCEFDEADKDRARKELDLEKRLEVMRRISEREKVRYRGLSPAVLSHILREKSKKKKNKRLPRSVMRGILERQRPRMRGLGPSVFHHIRMEIDKKKK